MSNAEALAMVGRKVTIGHDWHGEIDAVSVYRNGGASFNVVWWDGSSRKSEWVSSSEFTLRGADDARG